MAVHILRRKHYYNQLHMSELLAERDLHQGIQTHIGLIFYQHNFLVGISLRIALMSYQRIKVDLVGKKGHMIELKDRHSIGLDTHPYKIEWSCKRSIQPGNI